MLQFYKPRPELQNFISRIMLSHSKLDSNDSVPTVPFPPQPEHCLFFYPYDKVTCHNYASGQLHELPAGMFVGPQLTRVYLTMGHNILVNMVSFHPGGIIMNLCGHSILSTANCLKTTLDCKNN